MVDQPPFRMLFLERKALKDLYLINHTPRRSLKSDGAPPTKQQAHEVLEGLANCPVLMETTIGCIEFNRYDVLAHLRPSANVQHLAATLFNWDNYKMRNLSNMSLIPHNQRMVIQHHRTSTCATPRP